MFQDITTLLLDPKAFKDTIDLFVERYKGKNIFVVAGKRKFSHFFNPCEREGTKGKGKRVKLGVKCVIYSFRRSLYLSD